MAKNEHFGGENQLDTTRRSEFDELIKFVRFIHVCSDGFLWCSCVASRAYSERARVFFSFLSTTEAATTTTLRGANERDEEEEKMLNIKKWRLNERDSETSSRAAANIPHTERYHRLLCSLFRLTFSFVSSSSSPLRRIAELEWVGT
jgi:hypothetical protein